VISLLEIAQNMNEADDDRYVSIGYGRYKEKGKEDDDNADVYVKTDSGKFVKSSDQESDDDGGKPEEPKGKSLGKGDFERDFDNDANRAADDEADDMDRDARFDADSADEDDDEEISDSNSGPIDMDDILDMLKKDPDIVDKMGDDVYFDGEDLVSSKFDDDTIGSVYGNMTLGDLKKQIMDYEEDMDETITINGKKYKAIKESKKNPQLFKEIYERTFRSLKWNN